ncbi:TIGR03545 family protein [Roseimaritima sediminicola]|uniref:TIGR03545 family protein n=1 Tax=Roseimaritima sediminicola TaxID=2662066 RepID=UPI0012984B66|nr:TIGR03545 family protein [Roseimaritima sediminicola]
MIRWRFLLKRVLLVVAILALLRWSLGPLAQYASVWTLESAVGAKVDIARTRVELFPPRLQYVDLQIGDPREGKSHVNAFAAQRVELTIDGAALLHRRLVARDGRITGVRIGGRRASSGHLPQTAPEPASPSDEPSLVSSLLGDLGSYAKGELETVGNSLETVKRSEQIRQRWMQEYAALAARAEAVEQQVRSVRDQARGIDNPLRDLPRLKATIEQAEAIRQELVALRAKLDALPAQVQADWVALEEAKQIDLDRVRALVPEPVESPADLGPALLRQIVSSQIEGVREYLDSARQVADWTVASPEGAERPRGEDIRLVQTPPEPSFLIQRCQLDGVMSVNRESYTLTGILENLTPQTRRLQQPLRARFRLEGPRTVRVDFRRHYDSQGGPPRDVLTAHWPQLALPRTEIGNADEAQLAIDGGPLELYVQIETLDDQMHGQLVSRQANAQVRLETGEKLAGLSAIDSLQTSLQDIDEVQVQASFEGTWQDLDMAIATNLSGALADGMRNAMTAQIAASQQQLRERIEAEHRQQMRELQSWLGEQQLAARDVLAKADTEIDSLKAKLAKELPAAGAYLGRLNSTFQKLR